jgi:hypothetical protein
MRKRRPTRTELIARKRRRKRMNQIRNKAKLTLYILIVCFAVLQLARFVGFMVFSEEDNQIETQYVALKKEDEFSDDNMSKNIEQTKDTEETESQEEADASGDGLSYEQKLSIIQSNTDIYSADLLRCATNFPEAIDFVYQYPDNKDKSFNMDLTNDYVEGEIPLLLQWDTRWGYTKYGASILGLAGCGPTCVSMVYIGLTGDIKKNPHVIAQFSEENGYYISGSGSSWMLMTEGIRGLGLQSNELILLESAMKKELDAGHYVICSMKPGDFTNSGHFIVLIGYTDEGFKVNDPNSRINSEKIWSYDTLSPQIKNLWGISK